MTDDSKGPYRVEECRDPATMAFEVSSNTRMIGFYETRLSAIMACNAANAAHAAGVAQERERCAKVAERLESGQAVEIGGERWLLGSMQSSPVAAQSATALAIATAIRTPSDGRGT